MNIFEANNIIIPEGSVKRILDKNGVVLWKKPKDYTGPFYVMNTSNSNKTLSIKKTSENNPTFVVEKSTDAQNWTVFGTTSTTALTYTLTPGDKLYLRANTNTWGSGAGSGVNISGCPKVGGNIMSLLYGSEYTGRENTFPTNDSYTFGMLFFRAGIEDVSDLLLPAMVLSPNCYDRMFFGCKMANPPTLPATTLAQGCYYQMFYDCSSLITAPVLPATELAPSCYMGMFQLCSSMTSITLPAKTLTQQCYYLLVDRCTNLNNIECYATDMSATNCISDWVKDVAASGTFYRGAGVEWPTGTSGIPEGWEVVDV